MMSRCCAIGSSTMANAVHSTGDDPRRDQRVLRQPFDERLCLPFAEGCSAVKPLTSRRTTLKTGQVRLDGGLVHCPAGDCGAICREGMKPFPSQLCQLGILSDVEKTSHTDVAPNVPVCFTQLDNVFIRGSNPAIYFSRPHRVQLGPGRVIGCASRRQGD